MKNIKTKITLAMTVLALASPLGAMAAEKNDVKGKTSPTRTTSKNKTLKTQPDVLKEVPFDEIKSKLFEAQFNVVNYQKKWYSNQMKIIINTIPTIVSPDTKELYEHPVIAEKAPFGKSPVIGDLVKGSAAYKLMKRGAPNEVMTMYRFAESFGEPVYQLPFDEIGCYKINEQRSEEGLGGLTWQREYIYVDIDKYGRPVEFSVYACDGIVNSVSAVYYSIIEP